MYEYAWKEKYCECMYVCVMHVIISFCRYCLLECDFEVVSARLASVGVWNVSDG